MNPLECFWFLSNDRNSGTFFFLFLTSLEHKWSWQESLHKPPSLSCSPNSTVKPGILISFSRNICKPNFFLSTDLENPLSPYWNWNNEKKWEIYLIHLRKGRICGYVSVTCYILSQKHKCMYEGDSSITHLIY